MTARRAIACPAFDGEGGELAADEEKRAAEEKPARDPETRELLADLEEEGSHCHDRDRRAPGDQSALERSHRSSERRNLIGVGGLDKENGKQGADEDGCRVADREGFLRQHVDQIDAHGAQKEPGEFEQAQQTDDHARRIAFIAQLRSDLVSQPSRFLRYACPRRCCRPGFAAGELLAKRLRVEQRGTFLVLHERTDLFIDPQRLSGRS
jgi:hypothetical protein